MREAERPVRRESSERLRLLAPFACLYASFGLTLGLLGSGAPMVMRASGMPLAQTGLLQLIYLPIGIAFVWAPLLDGVKLPMLPHRLGWIVAAQSLAVMLLLCLSLAVNGPAIGLVAIGLGISIAMASMDISLEALVVESVADEARPFVTTSKLVGSAVGTAAGIALATASSTMLPLSRALAIAALLDVALLVPILFHPESSSLASADRQRAARNVEFSPGQRRLAPRAILLGCYFAASIALGSTPSFVLLDLHVPLDTVGLVTGPAQTMLGIAATILSGALLTWMAADVLIMAWATGAGASGLLFVLATSFASARLGLVATLMNAACLSGLAVPVFNVIYRWAEGRRPGRDYAILFGAAFLASFPARVLSPMLASTLGWPGFFTLCTPLFLGAVILLARATRPA